MADRFNIRAMNDPGRPTEDPLLGPDDNSIEIAQIYITTDLAQPSAGLLQVVNQHTL